MPDYSFPGVFVEETSFRSREIEGVPTATTGFVGCTVSGPVDKPVTVESLADYQATFGTMSAAQPLPLAVEEFFLNGGRKAIIVRIRSDSRRGLAATLMGTAKGKTGLHALQGLEDRPGLLVVPDVAYLPEKEATNVTTGAAAYSEAHGMFYIADIPKAVADKGRDAAVRWASGLARCRNMALHYPWLVRGAGSRPKKTVRPPSAIAAGVFARVDQTRGVWKAPAGQDATAIGVTGMAHNVTPADAETLSGAAINPIRKISGNIVLWGARTFAPAGDSEWKYVNIRRFFLFLERSIKDGLSWAVFEPNGEPLWAQIRLEVYAFLHTAWRAGALQGATPKDAYFVRCDATTMT